MTLQRLEMVADILDRNFRYYSIIDLGCRTQELRLLLKGCAEYVETDLAPAPGMLKCDLASTLPFKKMNIKLAALLMYLNIWITTNSQLQKSKA